MPTKPGDPRHTRAWKKVRAARLAIAAAHDEPCWRCGQAINYRLPGTHPYGPTGDHVDPVGTGGRPLDITNVKPAHRTCNLRHGSTLTNGPNKLRTTRDW